MDGNTITEDISVDNLTWSQEEFTLSDFIDKFPLPQIVKVAEGYYGPDEDSCLGADQILFLHAKKHTEKVQARDVRKRTLHIPLNCSQKIEIRPSNLQEAFESVFDLAKIFVNKRIPQFVRVTQGFDDDNVCVNLGDKLKLLKLVTEQGKEHLVVEPQDGSGLPLSIPLSASARFQPLTDGREYYIKEAVSMMTMPFFFQFIKPLNIGDTGEASIFNSALGVLYAEKTYQDATIVCTTNGGEAKTVVTLPKSLQVTITAASGALVGDKEYMKICKFYHDGVSLKRIENMECFNVFASRDTIREYQYENFNCPSTTSGALYTESEDNDEDDTHEYSYIPDEISSQSSFDYEVFKDSFDKTSDDNNLSDTSEGDDYEDMDENPHPKSSVNPVLHLKKTAPPVKPKPFVTKRQEDNHHPESECLQHQYKPTPLTRTQRKSEPALHIATPNLTTTPTQDVQKTHAKESTSSKVQHSKEIEDMTVTEVSNFLEKHCLSEFITTFEYNQVDGDLLMSMDLEMMEALGMNKFQQKKLSKLIQGWRPKC